MQTYASGNIKQIRANFAAAWHEERSRVISVIISDEKDVVPPASLVMAAIARVTKNDNTTDHRDGVLLEEAVAMIRCLRDKIGKHSAGNVRDALTFLEEVSVCAMNDDVRQAHLRTALLDAEIMLRDLYQRSMEGSCPELHTRRD